MGADLDPLLTLLTLLSTEELMVFAGIPTKSRPAARRGPWKGR
ncbi:MAG: hypothetical protein ACODUE_08475 [Synechococcus sp.]